jgi:hypothetical protein
MDRVDIITGTLGKARCSRWYAIDARAPAAVDGGSEVVKMNPGA